MLVSVTSVLAIVNCLLLIKTKTWLHRLNEAWLGAAEKVAITTLRSQRKEIMTRLASAPSEAENAELELGSRRTMFWWSGLLVARTRAARRKRRCSRKSFASCGSRRPPGDGLVDLRERDL